MAGTPGELRKGSHTQVCTTGTVFEKKSQTNRADRPTEREALSSHQSVVISSMYSVKFYNQTSNDRKLFLPRGARLSMVLCVYFNNIIQHQVLQQRLGQ